MLTIGDLTALTYQMLSVIGTDNPFEELARERWVDELAEGGRTCTDAEAWIEDLARTNRNRFHQGIRRRARIIRRDVMREDPARLEEALHPNARELIARLADVGIGTIILDECHHLLDHWALVVHCLVNRLRARGISPLLINDVDYELPTPAVVKEGNRAPYRSFAWFTRPQKQELEFIRHHERRLAELIRGTLTSPAGQEFLTGVLQIGEGPREQRLALAFKADPIIAEAAARMLHTTTPAHPLIGLLPGAVAARPDTESLIRLLARYALTMLLPDPGAEQEWAEIKAVLVDFGYHLTDRGIRRGRDPIDLILAAADEIADMRPVLVTARHLRAASRDAHVLAVELGGILEEDLTPVVVEGMGHVSEIPVRADSARTLAAVSELMTRGVISLIIGTRGLLGEGWDYPAVNTLIDISSVATSTSTQQLRGRTLRLDPQWSRKVAHNWAITSMLDAEINIDATGDLGRLHRKLSTVWGLSLGGSDAVVKGEYHTLSPAHQHALQRYAAGEVLATVDRINDVCRNEFPTRAQTYDGWRIGEPYLGATAPLARIEPDRSIARPFHSGLTFEAFFLTVLLIFAFGMVQITRGAAGIGVWTSPGMLLLLAAVVVAVMISGRDVRRFLQSIRQFALPLSAYQGATRAIAETLAGRSGGPTFGVGNIYVQPERVGRLVTGYTVTLVGGGQEEQSTVLDTLQELFAPIGSPRFVLEVGVTELTWRRPVSAMSIAVMRLFGYRGRFFGLPRALGRRRQDARFFADRWEAYVGPCVLHEISAPEDIAILTTARRQFAGTDTRVRRREVWS